MTARAAVRALLTGALSLGGSSPGGARPRDRTTTPGPTRPAGPRTGRRGPRHAPRVPFALVVVGLVVGCMTALLALNTASAANELRRHDLAAQDANIAAHLQDLRNEVAAATAPGNIAAAAAQLGMVPAGNPAFLVIAADGAVRVLGKPASVAYPPPPQPSTTLHPSPTKKLGTPTKSTTSAGTSTSAKTAGATSTAGTTGGRKTGHAAASPSPAPSPTPTPTPVVTLPGGNR